MCVCVCLSDCVYDLADAENSVGFGVGISVFGSQNDAENITYTHTHTNTHTPIHTLRGYGLGVEGLWYRFCG